MTHQYLDTQQGGRSSWMHLYHDLIYFVDSFLHACAAGYGCAREVREQAVQNVILLKCSNILRVCMGLRKGGVLLPSVWFHHVRLLQLHLVVHRG